MTTVRSGASTLAGRQASAGLWRTQTAKAAPSKRLPRLTTCASSERGGGFSTGFIVGGAIFGSLGFLFAPQISRALLTEDQKLKLPRFLEEEIKDPEQTKQELADKIAQLNAAIDDVSNQLKAKDPKPEIVEEALG